MPHKDYPNKKNITIWLDKEWIVRLDRLASKTEVSRARLVENVIKTMVEELETVDKIGVLRLSVVLRDMQEGIKAWAERVKEDPSDLMAGIVTPGR